MKKVMVYGAGNLGLSVLIGLANRGVELYRYAFTNVSNLGKELTCNNQEVEILSCDDLRLAEIKYEVYEEVSYIIVTLTGDVLEKEIDFLLTFDIPLVILSTKYDVARVKGKVVNACGRAVISENMALPIVDFWDRLSNLKNVPESVTLYVNVLESHQSKKADISGSAIKVLDILEKKGFVFEFTETDKEKYKEDVDGTYGCINCLREELSQEHFGIAKKYLSGHAYHSFWITSYVKDEKTIDYLNYVFDTLHSLEAQTIPDVIDIQVELSDFDDRIELYISHNINGRDIYSDGVVRCINFLQETMQTGAFSGIDVVNS